MKFPEVMNVHKFETINANWLLGLKLSLTFILTQLTC